MIHFFIILGVLLFFVLLSQSKYPFEINNTKRFFFIISFCFMGILCALKSGTVGNDTYEYIRVFELGGNLEDLLDTRYEKGFLYYTYYLHTFSGGSVQILFIVSSIIIYFSFGHFIWKYSQVPWLSILLFFLLLFGATNNILRQCLAMSFILWSIDFFLQKRYIWSALLFLVAIQFHTSAVITLFIVFFPRIKLNWMTFFIILAIAFISLISFSSILEIGFNYLSAYESYSDSVYFTGEARLATFVQISFSFIFSLIGMVGYNRAKVKSPFLEKVLRIFILMELSAFGLYFISLRVNLIDRFALYYYMITIILIPNSIIHYSQNNRRLYSLGVVLSLFSYLLVSMILRPEWNSVYPYSFFWQ